ncbi:MAG TPA: rhodanese-like domain-containing protein [Thermoplasmataceae archaeon]|nr:rhodanese-like domain-containing protein [Thermoplasmataceae archaeon]
MEKVPIISKDEVLKVLNDKNYVILNVLSKAAYDDLHIKNSVSMPLDILEMEAPRKLDKNKKYVTYCASSSCGASKRAAEVLIKNGITAFAYEGGIKEWSESGLPVEGKKVFAKSL